MHCYISLYSRLYAHINYMNYRRIILCGWMLVTVQKNWKNIFPSFHDVINTGTVNLYTPTCSILHIYFNIPLMSSNYPIPVLYEALKSLIKPLGTSFLRNWTLHTNMNTSLCRTLSKSQGKYNLHGYSTCNRRFLKPQNFDTFFILSQLDVIDVQRTTSCISDICDPYIAYVPSVRTLPPQVPDFEKIHQKTFRKPAFSRQLRIFRYTHPRDADCTISQTTHHKRLRPFWFIHSRDMTSQTFHSLTKHKIYV